MKKIFIFITFLLFLPIMVRAEETCTQEKLNSYLQYIDKYKITLKEMDNSGTYQVWVNGIVGGIALDNGRIVFNDGFLGYGIQGETLNIKVYVADGGDCAGHTIKYVQVAIPKKEVEKQEPSVPPVISEPSAPPKTNPPTNNNGNQNSGDQNNNSNQGSIKPPEINQEKPIEENVSKDDQNNNSAVDNDSNINDDKDNNNLSDEKNKEFKKDNKKIYLIISISFFVIAILLVMARLIFKKFKLRSKAS